MKGNTMRKINNIKDLEAIQENGELEEWVDNSMNRPFFGVRSLGDHAHLVACLVSLVKQRLGVHSGGSFVKAVDNNNLMEAFIRADDVNAQYMRIYVEFVYMYLPMKGENNGN